jgi:hypothetical protein
MNRRGEVDRRGNFYFGVDNIKTGKYFAFEISRRMNYFLKGENTLDLCHEIYTKNMTPKTDTYIPGPNSAKL